VLNCFRELDGRCQTSNLKSDDGCSCLGESLGDIGEQVSLGLDTDGDTDEVVLNSELSSVFSGDGAVGHDGGVLSEGLNTSEGLSEGNDLETLEESLSGLDISLDVEGEHTSETSGLLLGDVVLGVALEAGVDDLINLGVGLEELGNSHGVGAGSLDTDFEGLGSSEGDPGVEGGEASSHGLQDEEESVVKVLVVHNHASGNNVGVTTDVLGDGVGDDISTEVEGVLVDGGEEGVVDNEEDASSLEGVSNLSNVVDFEGGVGGGLEPDNLGVGSDFLLEVLDVEEASEGHLDVGVLGQDFSQVSLGTTVHIVDAEDVVTGLEELHEGNVSSHAGGGGEGVLSVLDGSEGSLEVGTGGVSASGVVEDDGDTGSGLGVGGGHVDGRDNTVELLGGFVTGVDQSGGDTPTSKKKLLENEKGIERVEIKLTSSRISG